MVQEVMGTRQLAEQPQHEPTTWTRFGLLWKRVWTWLRPIPGTEEERPHDGRNASTWTRLGLLCKRVWVFIRPRSRTREEQPQHEPSILPDSIPVDDIQSHGTCNPYQHVDQEQEKEDQPQDETSSSGSAQEPGEEKKSNVQDKLQQGEEANPEPGNQPQVGSSLSGSVMHVDENEEMVITNIRVTDIALGLRRLPAGFYAVVRHSDLEWRTENKPSSADDDVVEWNGPIPLPSDRSASICVEVYASFEFQPTLGTGEHLRELTITVEQILGCDANSVPFTFFTTDGDVVSPCSTIFVTVRRSKCQKSDPPASRVLVPHCSVTEPQDELDDVTNQGHRALSRYRKHGERRDLDRSIAAFERALSICPLDHPCRAAARSNLAMVEFIRCQVEDKDVSFGVPIELYCDALAARPVGHVDRPATLIQLAVVHFARFEKQRIEAEVAQAEALLHEAMQLSSPGGYENRAATFLLQLHAERRVDAVHQSCQSPVELDPTPPIADDDPWDLSLNLLQRFQRFGDLTDLQQAITLLQTLVQSVSTRDARYIKVLGNLSAALLYRFECLGELGDLDDAISTLRNIIDITPHGHPYKPTGLNNLGSFLVTRFKRFGELSDLGDAISILKDAVDLTPHGHPDMTRYLNNLGGAFVTRFECLGELSDLEDAISTLRDSIDLTPHGHPEKPGRLNNLGISLRTRFERLGELNDLEDAILTLKVAVDLTPDGHPTKPGHLESLGNSFRARFERLGELSDLEDAITTLSKAVELTPHGNPHEHNHLNNLGYCFRARFERLGELTDIEVSISTLKNAVDLTPHGHPDKPGHLHNLGSSFSARFERLGELSDLEDAISTHRDAVDLVPRSHPDKPLYLNSLGSSFRDRFEHLGKPSDLEDAISTHRDAVELTPNGHPGKPDRLNNLGISLGARFECTGELSDLEDAISAHQQVVDLTPHGHPDKPDRLSDLGSSFKGRFDRLGDLSDLEGAISTHRNAIDLLPCGHPRKPLYLNRLGNSFRARFERLGELSDLEDAISAHRGAIDLTPHGHPHNPGFLNNLGNAFSTRFERLGELSDLEGAVLRHRDAVDLTPHGHPDKPHYLNSLGSSFRTRFERLGELSDLEDAILTHRNSVDLTPSDHPDKPGRLNNLGNTLRARFERFAELGDLEDAISTHQNAVGLTPRGHPHKPFWLYNLGISFRVRFECLGELRDLEDAISRLKDAVDLTPHGHPHKLTILNHLGDSFRARFEHLGEPSDLEVAITCYSHAASTPIGPITHRFHASQRWISCAQCIPHRSLLHAYATTITLLPQLAWVGLSLKHRYTELKQGANVVRDAAAAALDAGLPETAVEWLEQGRSIVWESLLQLRSSYEELSAAHPDHARRLRELSVALDNAGATRERTPPALSEQTQESLQQVADRHRMLAIERDKLFQEIRHFPGFERFLSQKTFPQLSAAAHSGPVVIINAAESRCDALVVLADVDHVIHVPLPKFNFRRSAGLQNMLGKLLGHARDTVHANRKGGQATRRGFSWESLLSILWNDVIKPILDALAFSTPGGLSRIFWCPSGPFVFLPIHAAGLYDTQHSSPGHKVSDFVISSYAPTLSILSQSPNPHLAPSSDLRLLLVRQPPSDGQIYLRGVPTELEHIRTVVESSPSACTTLMESSVGTVEEVLGLMMEAHWVHFACHGIQDAASPTESGLCLADERRLKISDIIALSRSRGGLAFLSACQTAMGDEELSDEAIHIAAGMLFSGYGGIIGTMWSISDRYAPEVARDVYKYLFREGTRPDYRNAARALHEAVGHLRDSEKPFATWLPFIHVGL